MEYSSFRKQIPKNYKKPRCITDICNACFNGLKLFEEKLGKLNELCGATAIQPPQQDADLTNALYTFRAAKIELFEQEKLVNETEHAYLLEWLYHRDHVVKRRNDYKKQKQDLKPGQVKLKYMSLLLLPLLFLKLIEIASSCY